MKLSVVTVSYNAQATIRETIRSVAALGDTIFEYVVIDGASTDATLSILDEEAPSLDGRLRVFSERDNGIYDAMNKGIDRVDGEWVLFLGADDVLLPGAAAFAEHAPSHGVDMVCADVEVVDARGAVRVDTCRTPRLIGHLPREMPNCHQGMTISTEAYRALGGFNTLFRIAADYELFIRFAKAGYRWEHLDALVSRFALGGTSSARWLPTAREYREARVRHGLSPLASYLAFGMSFANSMAARGLSRVDRSR